MSAGDREKPDHLDTSRDELLPIGRFASESRLSLKALRLYDAQGLLPPAHVDPDSGYRYYRPAQLETARLIGMLRQLDMPLRQIARIINAGGTDSAGMLQAYREELQWADFRRTTMAAIVDRHLRGDQIMHRVETRNVPERKLLSFERRTLADELPNVIRESGDKLFKHVASTEGVQAAGPMLVIFHGVVTMEADGPVEVAVPVEGDPQPFGEARVRLEAAHQEAYARITKRQVEFPEILTVYDSVESWLKRSGKRPAGPPREVYFADWSALGPDDYVCDIAWPYEG